MDSRAIEVLMNTISRFIHLMACQTIKVASVEKEYKTMVGLMKILKVVLGEISKSDMSLDENLINQFEEFDVVINEIREYVESWCPKTSKICMVIQSEPFMQRMRRSFLETCCELCRLLQSSTFSSLASSIQHCLDELQCVQKERMQEMIDECLRQQRNNQALDPQYLIKIIESLDLVSNQELLLESINLVKERKKALIQKSTLTIDSVEQLIELINHIRNFMFKLERFEMIDGIIVPPYFRCPLSLELMLDPVIVATGQTYERAFIQKWLDHDLKICPITRQGFTHTNLIPNYTVKALISNWCEVNHIKLSNPICGTPVNFDQANLFNDSSFDLIKASDKPRNELSLGNEGKFLSNEGNFNVQVCSSNPSTNPFVYQSYCHSRSESDASRLSSKCDDISEIADIDNESQTSPLNRDASPTWFAKGHFQSSGNRDISRNSNQPSEMNFDDLTTCSYVERLIDDLENQSDDVQSTAATELRLLAKHNMENRAIIVKCGAVKPLISLLYSKVKRTQENSVTALLNISINSENKTIIAEEGAIEPLIHVLKTGSAEAKENAAATIFSLSVLEEYKVMIGRSGAIKVLVDLLGSGTLRGKKDAATALFNLSICHENKVRIVQAGAVKYLVEMIDPDGGMCDKAVALLSNLSTVQEGRNAIAHAGGIPLLVEVVDGGSQRGKENAASTLFQLCLNSRRFSTLILQEGSVPPLVALSQSGTPRAKEKAQQILSHFRNQREGSVGKTKSRT